MMAVLARLVIVAVGASLGSNCERIRHYAEARTDANWAMALKYLGPAPLCNGPGYKGTHENLSG